MARIPRRGIKLPKTKQPCGHGWDKLDQGCMACIDEQLQAQADVIAELNIQTKVDGKLIDGLTAASRKSGGTIKLGSCVWCEWIWVDFKGDSLEPALKAHVLKECKKHPMRKLERKIARLEKRR
jgi:hypothetical protein